MSFIGDETHRFSTSAAAADVRDFLERRDSEVYRRDAVGSSQNLWSTHAVWCTGMCAVTGGGDAPG